MQKRTLVLGASLKRERYSNVAIQKLIEKNHPVEAIGLNEGKIQNVIIQSGKPRLEGIHTVTLYLNAQRQIAYYDYIIALQPKRVIFNPGTENNELERLLMKHDITVEIACNLVLLATNQY